MAISKSMLNATIEVRSKSNIDLIKEQNYKLEYGASVKVHGTEHIFFNAKDSYVKYINVNDEIDRLLDKIKYLEDNFKKEN